MIELSEIDPGHLQLQVYRDAAALPPGNAQYKGLRIHGYPEIHEKVGELARSTLLPGAKVLDIAAGSGSMCLRLKDLGFYPTACDLVPENFRLHQSVEFVIANLNLPLPNALLENFDCVVATEIIEHLENPRHFLRQCFLALRPGGILFLSTPNIDSPVSRAYYVRTGQFRFFGDADYRVDGHITPVTLSVLRHALDETGFIATSVTSVVPIRCAGLSGWKAWLLGMFIKMLSKDRPPLGEILVMATSKPA